MREVKNEGQYLYIGKKNEWIIGALGKSTDGYIVKLGFHDPHFSSRNNEDHN